MNIYGDRGNVIALTQRARWRGIEVDVRAQSVGDRPRFDDVDVFFFGGGQDKEQVAVSRDLQGDAGRALLAAIEGGAALLSICGGYQLLGQYFKTGTGDCLPGISLFDAYTVAGNHRFIGDVVVECDFGEGTRTLVGFENHSGKTYLGSGCQPMGKSMVGCGNNGEDGLEGARYRSALGCYLHGSLLPKNPWLTDYLLLAGLRRRHGEGVELAPLDDALEVRAHDAVLERIRRRGRVNSAIKGRG
jgi:CobQ-like glutamine amidotransferase family enzyme